jgi:hypothetical protein
MIAHLAHCPICDMFLRPDEGCLHIARTLASPTANQGGFQLLEGGADPDASAFAQFLSHHAPELARA